MKDLEQLLLIKLHLDYFKLEKLIAECKCNNCDKELTINDHYFVNWIINMKYCVSCYKKIILEILNK